MMVKLEESIKTIKNLCEVSLILIGLRRADLIPTVLELLQIEIQDVVEEYCIVREG